MNCREFDAILLDLARGEAASPAMAEGRAHAASCARCATLLSEQQSLSVGLAALAALAEEGRAPERIESVLRAEFRRQDAQVPKPGVHQWRGATIASPFRFLGRRKAWALAALLIAVTGAAIVLKFLMRPKGTALSQTQLQWAVNHTPRPPAVAANAQSLGGQPASRSASPRRVSHPRGMVRPSPAPTNPQNSSDEWATNFYPLPYGSGLDLDEGWQMVRVNVPVSALASLGVPAANGASTVQYVKADVVLGGDGTARAIRFIR